MKPLSSCLCLPLQTGVKVVCKSLLLLSAISTSVNLYHLDYKGRRLESTVALAVVALFLGLLTASALVGHTGADRAGLTHVLTSLALLGCATAHWLVVALVSMQWDNAQSVWHVCLQNRCAETLWTVDFGFRNNSYDVPNDTESDPDLLVPNAQKTVLYDDAKFSGIFLMNRRISGHVKIIESDETLFEEEEAVKVQPKDFDGDENEEDTGEERRRTSSKQYPEELGNREKVVNSEEVNLDDEQKSPSRGVALVVNLVLTLILLAFFVMCATVICSYSTELYEVYKEKDALGREEEADQAEHNEVL